MRSIKEKTVIYLLFFFSGLSGLIYETVWLRMLSRILGSTVYATSLVLAAFMAGLALGSYFTGKIVDNYTKPLWLYAVIEAGVGVTALIFMVGYNNLIPLYRVAYAFAGGSRMVLTIVQSSLLFFILIIPTSLMGSTLPLLASYTKRFNTEYSQRLGFLYSLNTFGAALGVIVSGLILIGLIGELNTVLIGVLINLAVSFAAMHLFNKRVIVSSEKQIQAGAGSISPYRLAIKKIILLMFALSGFTAMGYEIIWARTLQLYLGTSMYSFSMMLGIYLSGVALGGYTGALFSKRINDPLYVFGLAQACITIYSIIGFYFYGFFKPVTISSAIDFNNIILVPLVIIFPITFILGAIFPIISKGFVSEERTTGQSTGHLYSANTIGCILGSLFCGFVLVGFIGTKWSLLMLGGVNLMISVTALLLSLSRKNSVLYTSLLILATGAVLWWGSVAPDPFLSAIKNEMVRIYGKDAAIYFHKESSTASTTVIGRENDPMQSSLLVNGIGMTHLCIETKIMAHLPLLLCQNPKKILVVCFGMGTTLRSASRHQWLNCETVELVPETYECFDYFHGDGREVLSNPRVRHYIDDGRNFLLMRDNTYDVITMDPAPPLWSGGTVNLYSLEFFELCNQRLNSGGVMCLWVPPAAYTEVMMILATFNKAFPNAMAWGGPRFPGIYLTGFKEPYTADIERFKSADKDTAIINDLTEWDSLVPNPGSLLKYFLLHPTDLADFTRGAAIITDNNPYTEFPLWRQKYDPNRKYILDGNSLYRWKKLKNELLRKH
ncbi:fused MFS/spermidine synthase [candidate division TA06 bacterium]|nr:fused MFS/spermidine synthase [candidate division TA06 bacterium]